MFTAPDQTSSVKDMLVGLSKYNPAEELGFEPELQFVIETDSPEHMVASSPRHKLFWE